MSHIRKQFKPAGCPDCGAPTIDYRRDGDPLLDIATYACGSNTDIPGKRISNTPACQYSKRLLNLMIERLKSQIEEIDESLYKQN